MDVLALLQKKQRCTSVHRCFLSRNVSLFEQFLKELIHLLIETFEKPFAEYERVIIHNQQVYDIPTFIIGKYKGVWLHDVQAIELAIILHLDQQGT